MRHRKSGRKLNRSNTHRAAMFKNMARALLTYEQIRTTEPKAKELRRIVDKLITMALRNDLHTRRQAYKVLGSHQMVQRLFDEIGPRFEGGQRRVLMGLRPRPLPPRRPRRLRPRRPPPRRLPTRAKRSPRRPQPRRPPPRRTRKRLRKSPPRRLLPKKKPMQNN